MTRAFYLEYKVDRSDVRDKLLDCERARPDRVMARSFTHKRDRCSRGTISHVNLHSKVTLTYIGRSRSARRKVESAENWNSLVRSTEVASLVWRNNSLEIGTQNITGSEREHFRFDLDMRQS